MYSHLSGSRLSVHVVVSLVDKCHAPTQPLVPPMSMTHIFSLFLYLKRDHTVWNIPLVILGQLSCVASQDLAYLQSTGEGGTLERQCCCCASTAQPNYWLLLPAPCWPPMQNTALSGLPWGKVTPFTARMWLFNMLFQHLGLPCNAVMYYF